MLSLAKTSSNYDACIRMSVVGNAIGNSIVDASKPKAVDPMFDLGKAYSEKEKAGQKALFFGGKSTDDLAPGNSNSSAQSTWKPSPDEVQQVLANVDRAQAEADQFTTQLSDAGKSPQFAALNMSEFVAQAQSLSDKLHVQPGFMKNSYDNAMSEASNPNNSWIGQKINLVGATAMFPLMVGEEFGRGLLNIPSGVAGAIPAADRLGQDVGAMLDTSLTTSDRINAAGNAIIDFSTGFTGLGAPATFFTGGLGTAPVTAKSNITTINGATRTVPLGFQSESQFMNAADELQVALRSSGIDDAVVGVRGSSVTGVSYKTGAPFGPKSDIDFFVESTKLTGGYKTSPNIPGLVNPKPILRDYPELKTWSGRWSSELGRKVTPGGFVPGTIPNHPAIIVR